MTTTPYAREALLDAAAKIMRDQGYARTRTRHVAQLAGYSEATLYKHFIDKTALMLAVLQERSAPFVQLLKASAGLGIAIDHMQGNLASYRDAVKHDKISAGLERDMERLR